MPPPIPAPMQDAVLAVLRQVREAGLPSLTRTALVKFVYLLDCLHAEQADGRTVSGARWYFHHFGPFAIDLATAMDELDARGLVQSRSGEAGDRDFKVFWIGEFPAGPSLSDVGLSPGAASGFGMLLRRYSTDLSKLLDYIYFRTRPMMEAVPGKPLSFEHCREKTGELARRPVHVLDQRLQFRMLALAHELKQDYERLRSGNAAALAVHRPIYDEEFKRAMAQSDSVSEPAGSQQFFALLS